MRLERHTHLDQVITGIGAIGKGHRLSMCLKIPQIDRPGEHIDLRTTIVDVIFARDLIAHVIQELCQSITKTRAPCMTHMQRPGGVGADIFDIHPLARTKG